MHQQDFVSFAYQYDDGGGNGRVHLIAAVGTLLHDGGLVLHGGTTHGAEVAVLVPIEYLEGLSCRTVLVRRDVVVRCAQAYHDPFVGFGHGLFQGECTYLLAVGGEHFVYITSGFRCQRRLYTDGYAVFYFSFVCISFFSSSWSLKKTNHCVEGWGSVDFSIVCCFIILGGMNTKIQRHRDSFQINFYVSVSLCLPP